MANKIRAARWIFYIVTAGACLLNVLAAFGAIHISKGYGIAAWIVFFIGITGNFGLSLVEKRTGSDYVR